MDKNIILNLNNRSTEEFVLYADAYQEAAKKLANIFLNSHGYSDLDGLPIIFLYRHAIELYLKAIILELKKLLHVIFHVEICCSECFKTHDFETLKNKIIKIIESNGLDKELIFGCIKNELKNIKQSEIITALDLLKDLDNNSYQFRYPVTNKGDACLEKHKVINLSKFINNMDNLCCNLEGMVLLLQNKYDAYCEFLES